jgi:HlyD family secretion protein
MNKYLKYLLIIIGVGGVLFATSYFIRTNATPSTVFETETLFRTSIRETTLVTGKIIPQDEVEIKPQIPGIIQMIAVEEGDLVNTGDLLARVKVVPNEQTLNSAQGRVEKGILSERDFNAAELSYKQAKQELVNVENDLQIIREGSTGGDRSANTNIRATVSGTVLEVPVEEGDQVIESNSFNAGTTIASIADLGKMIFEGQVDESEVAKIRVGTNLEVSLGAVPDQEFEASLRFIAPKGSEEQGTVQFKIEADVFLPADFTVRAGYSANASLVLQQKDSIPAIREALLQFDSKTQEPYVEVQTAEQTFERRDLTLGISDGINVEIIEGLEESDLIKVWNKTEEPDKIDENEE